MATLVIIQARMGSTRLPGKVLMPLSGRPVLWQVINRIKKAHNVDAIIVATTTGSEDGAIASLCKEWGIRYFRGDPFDVLKRYYDAVESVKKDFPVIEYIVRITADCPLIDPQIIDDSILEAKNGHYDYVSNTNPPTFPDGLDVEVFSPEALAKANQCATLKSDREHVTPYIRRVSAQRQKNIASDKDLSKMRWTLDTKEDYAFLNTIYNILGTGNSDFFSFQEVLSLLEKKPELDKVNNLFQRNEGYKKSLLEDRRKTEKINE